jgi:mannose-6-phosphate isomerase class I
VTCPYYSVYRAELDGEAQLNWTQPFVNVSILDGCGTLDGMPVKKGDHLLICADYGEMTLMGKMELIWSYVE